MHILWFILIGLVAGWLAGKIMKGRGFGVFDRADRHFLDNRKWRQYLLGSSSISPLFTFEDCPRIRSTHFRSPVLLYHPISPRQQDSPRVVPRRCIVA